MSESALDESMKAVSFIKLVYRKPPTRQVILHAFITTLSNKEKIKHNPEIVFFFAVENVITERKLAGRCVMCMERMQLLNVHV